MPQGIGGPSDLRAFRLALAAQREGGASFADAWAAALEGCRAHGLTSEALWRSREAWRAAYEGEPPDPRHAAAGLLADLLGDLDGSAAPDRRAPALVA